MARCKGKTGIKYDSRLEKALHENQLAGCRFHDRGDRIDYVVHRRYEPDFAIAHEGKTIYIEAKGFFRQGDRQKYKAIGAALEAGTEELVFVFMQPMKPLPGAKTRKNGTKRTHAEWCEDEGFRIYKSTDPDLMEKILNG